MQHNDVHYIALEDPAGDDYGRLLHEAKAPIVQDGVHSSLFYIRPDVAPTQLEPMVGFIRKIVSSQTFSATALEPQTFENETLGYRFDIDQNSKGELLKAAGVLATAKLISNPALGDSLDQQYGNLHMAIFAPIREEQLYKRAIAALKKYKNMVFRFNSVLFDPKVAMNKTSLNKTSTRQFRTALASWSDDELTAGFFPGLYDEGVDEFGRQVTAADLILDEWMMRVGYYDDIKAANLPARNDGDMDRVRYNEYLKSLRDARIAEQADDESLYR
jgi:hypothetical protein